MYHHQGARSRKFAHLVGYELIFIGAIGGGRGHAEKQAIAWITITHPSRSKLLVGLDTHNAILRIRHLVLRGGESAGECIEVGMGIKGTGRNK